MYSSHFLSEITKFQNSEELNILSKFYLNDSLVKISF